MTGRLLAAARTTQLFGRRDIQARNHRHFTPSVRRFAEIAARHLRAHSGLSTAAPNRSPARRARIGSANHSALLPPIASEDSVNRRRLKPLVARVASATELARMRFESRPARHRRGGSPNTRRLSKQRGP